MEKTYVKTRENLFVIEEEGVHLVFDPEEGDEWPLNETGAFIVKNLIHGDSLEEITEKLMKEYDAEAEEAEEVLLEYVDVLKERGIVLK